MGAWEVGCFGNDDAMDWLADVYESDSLEIVDEALNAVIQADGSESLEAGMCAVGLAAAELIAAGSGRPSGDLPKEAAAWVRKHAASPSARRRSLARKVVERIGSNSELKDLWEDSRHFAQWQEVLADLTARLA